MTMTQKMPSVIIYADGAAKGNGSATARGGWGFSAQFSDGKVVENCGGDVPTTNNKMELQAVIQALSILSEKHVVDICTDSQYVIKGITEWLPGWKRKNWRSSTGEAVKNKELWQQLDALVVKHQVTWQWVRGHAGHPGNERADELANQGVPL